MDACKYKIVYSSDVRIYDIFSDEKLISPILLSKYPFGVIGSSHFNDYVQKLEKNGPILHEYDFYYTKQIALDLKLKETYTPRPYQENTARMIVEKHKQCGIIEAPTGAGKTNIISSLIAKKNVTTLIIVPSVGLVYQTRERLLNTLDIEPSKIGICTKDRKELNREILISTWQSMQNESVFDSILDYGYNMLIVDEAHRASAEVLSSIVSSFKSPFKFGLSATVYRTHEEQMLEIHKVLGAKIAKIDIEMLYQKNYLIRPTIKLSKTNTDLTIDLGVSYYFRNKLADNEKMRWVFANRLFSDSKYKAMSPKDRTIKAIATTPTNQELMLMAMICKGDYLQEHKNGFDKQLGLAKGGIDLYEPRFKKVVSEAKKLFNKERECGAILFNTVEAAERMGAILMENGYENIIVVHGKTPNANDTINKISKNKIRDYLLVSTIQFLGEGSDIPSLKKILIGSPFYPPFSDAARLQQIIGRGMRIDEESKKKKCNIVIADDNTMGWIHDKKQDVYNIVNNTVKPEMIDETKKIIFISGKKRAGKDTFSDLLLEKLDSHNIASSKIAFAAPIKRIICFSLNIEPDKLEEYKNNPNRYTITTNSKNISLKEYGVIKESISKKDVFKNFEQIIRDEIENIAAIDTPSSKEVLSIAFGAEGTTQTIREVLQRLGYDAMRKVYGEKIFGDKAIYDITRSSSNVIVISDARTPEEVECVKEVFKNTSSVKVVRKITDSSSDIHETESLIDSIAIDSLVDNNGSLEELNLQTENFVNEVFSKELKKVQSPLTKALPDDDIEHYCSVQF